jgi:hypothetical protein
MGVVTAVIDVLATASSIVFKLPLIFGLGCLQVFVSMSSFYVALREWLRLSLNEVLE